MKGTTTLTQQIMMLHNISAQSPPPPPLEMDPKIWNHLPPELLERVLSFLPLKTFISLRSTSKHFESLLFSPPFISQHSSSPSSNSISSFLLLSHPQLHQYFIYDTTLNTWRNLSLSLSLSPELTCAPLLSTSSCLLCFSAPSSSSFLVYNFLSRSLRYVKFPEYPFAFQLLTLVSTPICFKIFLLSSGASVSSSSAFVYNSRDQIWRQFESFIRPIIRDNFHQEGAFFNGLLYFVTPGPFSIVNFDLDTGKWDRLSTELPEELTFLRLASNTEGNRLFLFGGIGRNGISRSMKLWELSQGTSEGSGNNSYNWVEAERVPELMCRKFGSVCYHNYEHIYCFCYEGKICVCCYTWPEILYYKVSRRTWHWLPKCPSLPDKWSCGFRWFSFIPQLHPFV